MCGAAAARAATTRRKVVAVDDELDLDADDAGDRDTAARAR